MLVRAVGVHDEHLVALVWRAGGLEDQALAVGGPVGLGVLPAMRELPEVGEPLGLRRRHGGGSDRGKKDLLHRA